jgi:hypothetical protein
MAKVWIWLWMPLVGHRVFSAGWYDETGPIPDGPVPGHRAAALRFTHEFLWHFLIHPFRLVERLDCWLDIQRWKLEEGAR